MGDKTIKVSPEELKIKILDAVWGNPAITSSVIIESLEVVVKDCQ